MSASQVSHQRKRACSHHPSGDLTQPQLKKAKLSSSSSRSASPVYYLHTLSKVWLTREALRELNRRTRRVKSVQHRPEGQRPLTRGFHAELRNRVCSARTPASDFLQRCSWGTLKELKLFAKYGGPDLVELRGVCIPVSFWTRCQTLT